MFEGLQNKFQGVFKKLKGLGKISESNIQEGIHEIRLALLEADVNYKVVQEIEKELTQKAIGEKVHTKVSPIEQFYTIVRDELLKFLGNEETPLNLPKGKTGVILLAGLQGSGKTTTAGKLANLLKKDHSVLLVGADVYRPAAKEQLKILAEKVGVEFFTQEHDDAVAIVKNALKYAKKNLITAVILDTAGRLHIDEALMKELKAVKNVSEPDEIFLVADSMMGQNVVDVARSFNDLLNIDGVILSKFDSEAKAGAALSIKYVTGKPLRYLGVGEKMEDLEVFYPDRVVSRLLGRGDILSLIEKTQNAIEEEDAEAMAKKMMDGKIDLNDFLVQIRMIKKLGNFSQLLGMMPIPIPGVQNINPQKTTQQFAKMEAMILSMTKKEKENYKIIDLSRKKRIAKGSGVTLRDLTLFMDQFQKMGKMVKKMGKKAKLFANLDMSGLNLEGISKNIPFDSFKK
jgi:signal recognition particle subunit SRP54